MEGERCDVCVRVSEWGSEVCGGVEGERCVSDGVGSGGRVSGGVEGERFVSE